VRRPDEWLRVEPVEGHGWNIWLGPICVNLVKTEEAARHYASLLANVVMCVQVEARDHERATVVAWLRDRAGQYDPSSGIVTAIENRWVEIKSGDHEEARKHGELDDLLYSERQRRRMEVP
jgi:hypothetical protein